MYTKSQKYLMDVLKNKLVWKFFNYTFILYEYVTSAFGDTLQHMWKLFQCCSVQGSHCLQGACGGRRLYTDILILSVAERNDP
jgi:hypothetical protein